MKNLFLVVSIFLFVNNSGYGQDGNLKISDLKSGKYFTNKHVRLVSGKWKSTDNKFELHVGIQKKHIIKGEGNALDFYSDVLLVSFPEVICSEKNLSNKFDKISIECLGFQGENFYGSYRDPITQNDVSVTLTSKNGTIELLSKIYTITSKGNVKDGISFPYRLTFRKK